jgi:hypothetical protein
MKKLNGQNLLLTGFLLLTLLFSIACTCGSKTTTTTSTTAMSMTTESSTTSTTISTTTSTTSTVTTGTPSSTSTLSTTTESTTMVQEIINGMLDSQAKIKSYSFNTRISMEGSGTGTVTMDTTIVLIGAIDLENREIKVVGTALDSTTGDNGEMGVEAYVVDGMMYSKSEGPRMEPVWEIERLSEADWEDMTGMVAPFASYLELLETAEVSVIGSEEINGVDCYVLELTPDVKDLWQTVGQQIPGVEEEMLTIDETMEFLMQLFTSFSVKQWVAKDTYFLTRSEIEMSIKGIPGTELENGMTYNMIFYAYDQNKPFSIEVPPEALAAATTVP